MKTLFDDDEMDDELYEEDIWISPNTIFTCEDMPKLQIAAEICEDLWVPNPPSVAHAFHGANLIVNLSASDEVAGKDSYRKSLVSAQSARLLCGYIYATAGEGESTQDVVYGGHDLIAENGSVLAESKRFANGADLCRSMDIHRLDNERRRMTTCQICTGSGTGRDRTSVTTKHRFTLENTETVLVHVNLIPDHSCRESKDRKRAPLRGNPEYSGNGT